MLLFLCQSISTADSRLTVGHIKEQEFVSSVRGLRHHTWIKHSQYKSAGLTVTGNTALQIKRLNTWHGKFSGLGRGKTFPMGG